MQERLRDEKLLHLLRVARDCVDSRLVQWALRMGPHEDVCEFLAKRRKLCASSAKTGLVRALEATPSPATPLAEHPELEALDKVVGEVMETFVDNGNEHVSYWVLERQLRWEERPEFEALREHFTLPRLLAAFSVFDHSFSKQMCGLSMRNFAVYGSEACVKRQLLEHQEGKLATPCITPSGAEDPGGERMGEFVSVVALLRELRWPCAFGPHIGEFLEWAWNTPGLELGVRFSQADFASKDIPLQSQDRSEKSALVALATRLSAQKQLTEHIASCRSGLSWREYGLGSLEKFVTKYTGWFVLRGEYITLLEEKKVATANDDGANGGTGEDARGGTGDEASSEVINDEGGAKQSRSTEACRIGDDRAAAVDHDFDEDEDSDDDDGKRGAVAGDIGREACCDLAGQGGRDGTGAGIGKRWRFPRPFALCDGVPYHEACLENALAAPHPASGPSRLRKFDTTDFPGGVQDPTSSFAAFDAPLGDEILRFASTRCLSSQDWTTRVDICDKIAQALRGSPSLSSDFPELRVSIIGTSGSGLGRKDSDLDLLLELDSCGNACLDRAQALALLQAAVEAVASVAGAEELELVPAARIPLLRGRLGDIRFDLSLGTACGLWNTALLRSLGSRDPGAVLPLCVAVASWSKAQGVNDSPAGLLSTYSLLLLVVFFLQSWGEAPEIDLAALAAEGVRVEAPPTLPPEVIVGGAGTLEAVPPSPPEDRERSARLGRLLQGFFAFVVDFPWDASVVSVRCGAAFPRTLKPRSWKVHPMCIEDPFETHLNTCRRINPRAQRKILCAAEAAYRALLAGKGLDVLIPDRPAAGQRPARLAAAAQRVAEPA